MPDDRPTRDPWESFRYYYCEEGQARARALLEEAQRVTRDVGGGPTVPSRRSARCRSGSTLSTRS